MSIKKTYTKEYIQSKISTDIRWVERSLIKLFERQTEEEKNIRYTTEENSRGFNKPDSNYLSYCSRWVMSGNTLNGKHLEKCRGKLMKYWKQIQEEIILNQSRLS